MRFPWWLASALVACTSGVGDPDQLSEDVGTPPLDAGRDAGPTDQGSVNDSGAGPVDLGFPDGGVVPDAAPNDVGVTPDSGVDPFSTDRGLFFGGARCAGSGLAFCEDFETGALDTGRWQAIGERLTVENGQAARGTYALHVVTQSTEALHFIRTTQTAPAFSRQMWGRLFFRTEGPRPTAFNHWTVVEATGTVPEGGTGRIRYGGIHIPDVVNHFLFNYDIWGDRPATFHEVGAENDVEVPDGTWHCIEWYFDVDAQQARFFHDGTERPELGAEDLIDGIDLAFPEMDGLNVGWAIYQDIGASTWDAWVDEIAVDDTRIGCVR